jgi:hypothetical protein
MSETGWLSDFLEILLNLKQKNLRHEPSEKEEMLNGDDRLPIYL